MRVDPREWEELRLSISIDPEQIKRLCGVSERPWRRWKIDGPPAAVMALASAACHGCSRRLGARRLRAGCPCAV